VVGPDVIEKHKIQISYSVFSAILAGFEVAKCSGASAPDLLRYKPSFKCVMSYRSQINNPLKYCNIKSNLIYVSEMNALEQHTKVPIKKEHVKF
jgi:hypothetical protein